MKIIKKKKIGHLSLKELPKIREIKKIKHLNSKDIDLYDELKFISERISSLDEEFPPQKIELKKELHNNNNNNNNNNNEVKKRKKDEEPSVQKPTIIKISGDHEISNKKLQEIERKLNTLEDTPIESGNIITTTSSKKNNWFYEKNNDLPEKIEEAIIELQQKLSKIVPNIDKLPKNILKQIKKENNKEKSKRKFKIKTERSKTKISKEVDLEKIEQELHKVAVSISPKVKVIKDLPLKKFHLSTKPIIMDKTKSISKKKEIPLEKSKELKELEEKIFELDS